MVKSAGNERVKSGAVPGHWFIETEGEGSRRGGVSSRSGYWYRISTDLFGCKDIGGTENIGQTQIQWSFELHTSLPAKILVVQKIWDRHRLSGVLNHHCEHSNPVS